MEPKPLKEITKDYVHWGDLISKLAVFCHAKRIVEIGVQYADTTIHLCRAAKKVKGFVHGFDVFGPLPDTAYEEKSYGKLSKCLDRLKLHKKFFQLHQMDTRTDEFKEKK